MKANWNNLNKEERRIYMHIQMASGTSYSAGGWLPDDCSDCGACGLPMLGTGICINCYEEWKRLNDKLRKEVSSET